MKTLSLNIRLSLGIFLSLMMYASWAQPPMFLRDGPIRYFDDDDMALFKQSLDNALEHQPDNEVLAWHNEKTRSQGSVTPLNTSEQDGMRCRQVVISNTAKGLTRQSQLKFCRQDDGRWLFAQ